MGHLDKRKTLLKELVKPPFYKTMQTSQKVLSQYLLITIQFLWGLYTTMQKTKMPYLLFVLFL